jgi:hypothetical protein
MVASVGAPSHNSYIRYPTIRRSETFDARTLNDEMIRNLNSDFNGVQLQTIMESIQPMTHEGSPLVALASPLLAPSASSVEAVGVGDLEAEDGVASTSTTFSSRTFSSSSLESLRMMILSSPGSPRKSRLRSPKSLMSNSLSRETSAMRYPSSEDEERSTTGAFPRGTAGAT